MTKDQIIAWARDAGLYIATDVNWMPIIGYEYLELFAKLVAQAEREECAKVCEEEADDEMYLGLHYAEAIRARGQA